MDTKQTKLAGVLILEPDVFSDERGFFLETWNRTRYESVGIPGNFVQDNISFSKKGILRGLHFQYPQPNYFVFYFVNPYYHLSVNLLLLLML